MLASPATDELRADIDSFAAAVDDADWTALSACDGFTVHDVVAHVVAAADETAGTVEAARDGVPVSPTREFAVREGPYRELSSPDLRRALDTAFDRMCTVFDSVLRADPQAVVVSAGIPMPVAGMVTHKRSELALHRWDVAGDDDLSSRLLAAPELTDHAVVLGHLLLQDGARLFASTGTKFEARLRTPGTADVAVTVDAAGARMAAAEPNGGPAVHADAAARLLLLWGRRPTSRRRVTSDLDLTSRARLFGLLRGF